MNSNEIARRVIADDPAVLTVDPKMPSLAAMLDRVELAWCLPLDGTNTPRGKAVRIAQGGCSSVNVPLAPLLTVPLLAQVDRFVLVHSHPAGSLVISEADQQLTRHVLRAASLVGLVLVDHVVITPDGGSASFVERGLLVPYSAAMPQAAQ